MKLSRVSLREKLASSNSIVRRQLVVRWWGRAVVFIGFVCAGWLAYYVAAFDWATVAVALPPDDDLTPMIRTGQIISQILVSFPNQVALIGIVLALGLYAMRRRYRTYYGILEVVSGVVALYIFPVANGSPGQGPANWMTWLIGYVAPIYIIIRGLDNAEQGWPEFYFWPSDMYWKVMSRLSESAKDNILIIGVFLILFAFLALVLA